MLDQVEGVQHRLMSPALAPQRMKVRRAVFAGNHHLAVDEERRRCNAECSINDGRETVGPVMPVAGEAANPRAIPPHHEPVAVVFDFVNPERAGRRRSTFDGRHGSMKPEGRTIMLPPSDPLCRLRA